MLIYLVVLVVLLFLVLRYDLLAKTGGEKAWYYASLLMLILLAGFRYRVGGDTIIYMDLFDDNPTIKDLKTFDFGKAEFNPMWYVYNAPFRTLNSYFLLQMVQAVIVNCSFFHFFRKYTKYYFTAIFIYYIGYYFYFNMEIQREVLCTCLMLGAYPLIEKKKYLPYYLICAFAMTIHFSALMMMVLPLMKLVKRESYGLCLIVSGVIIVLMGVIDVVSFFLSLAFDERTAAVIRSYLAKGQANMTGCVVLYLIAVPFILLMFIRKRYKFTNDEFMGRMLMLLCVTQTVGMFVNGFNRFSNYLMPFGIIYIINTFYLNFNRVRLSQWASVLMSGALFVYFLNLGYYYVKDKSDDLAGMRVYNRYVPYSSIFNPKMDKNRERLILNERSGELMLDQ
ncbi:MAG: EpsG family protein [Bacteroidaceae bacterium]|nr:EpsG family protein [Bacteroidaceae bacterium]